MKRIIFSLILITLTTLAFSQGGDNADKDKLTCDINGVQVGVKLPKSKVITKFGNPVNYKKETYDEGYMEIYNYSGFEVAFDSREGLIDFFIKTDKIPFFTIDIEGGIRIGDNIDRLKNLGLYNWRQATNQNQKDFEQYSGIKGGTLYYFSPSEYDDVDLFEVLVKDGKIAALSFIRRID